MKLKDFILVNNTALPIAIFINKVNISEKNGEASSRDLMKYENYDIDEINFAESVGYESTPRLDIFLKDPEFN